MYKAKRNWENINIAAYEGAGEYEFPRMEPCRECDVDQWIAFKYAKMLPAEQRGRTGIHFFIDDYQFLRVWREPNAYIPLLRQFGAVMSPDFSVYTEFPKAMRIWNFYRNAWCGKYWQDNGINVIPNATWAGRESYAYCFDGLPEESIVGASSYGTMRTREGIDFFVNGLNAMIKKVSPKKVYVYGRFPKDRVLRPERIEEIETRIDMIRKLYMEKKKGV